MFEAIVILPMKISEDDPIENEAVYADSAYCSEQIRLFLEAGGIASNICIKGYRNNPLLEEEKAKNRERSKTRCRVEHIFGAMYQKAHDRVMRSIGFLRAQAVIGLRNLAYNMTRYGYLSGAKGDIASFQRRRGLKGLQKVSIRGNTEEKGG